MGARKRNGSTNGVANGKGTSVSRSQFVKNPGRYVDQAQEHGPVTITDARGNPRVMIVVPKAIVAFHDD